MTISQISSVLAQPELNTWVIICVFEKSLLWMLRKLGSLKVKLLFESALFFGYPMVLPTLGVLM